MRRKTRPREIAELGEHALIERLSGLLPREPRWVRIGRGKDDCAALDLGGDEWTLVTCDAHVEDTHFRREWIDPRTLGRRVASVNLSDIAAMGGQPRAALVSLAMPPEVQVSYYDTVMHALGARLAEFGAALVGGNLARSQHKITIDVTLLGRVRPQRCIRRSGAHVGDRVLVTGAPGEALAGLLRLQTGGHRQRDRLVRRFLDPEPRLRAGQILAAGGASALIDVSDGLATDLAHVCRASSVGAVVHQALLPISVALRRAAKRFRRAAWELVLEGGDDYELLCTVPAGRVATLKRRLRQQLNLALTDIGVICPPTEGLQIDCGGGLQPLLARGFEHFG